MSNERHGLKKLVVSSFDVQFTTNLEELAKTIGTSKKCLRRAYNLKRQESFEDEIVEKGKRVKRVFHYGFRRFTKKEAHKEREIFAPHPDVQLAFKAIKKWIEKISSSHGHAYGFVKKRNPKKAVKALLGNKHFFGLDIFSAFPSIVMKMVEMALKEAKVDKQFITLIAWFLTYWYSDHGDGAQRRLPQGSSCSPALLNRVYKPMCRRIDEVCKKHGIKKWIVYADDFSFASDVISDDAKRELLSVPTRYGFKVSQRKTRDNFGKTIPHILGLTIIRGEIHINHLRKNKFRRILFAAAKHSVYSHEHVLGIVADVKSIYGSEKNWPGWLLKPWQKYQYEMEVRIWKGKTRINCHPKTSKLNNQLSLRS